MMSTSASKTNSNNMIRSPKHCASAPIKHSSLKSEINHRKDDCATNSAPGEQQHEFFMMRPAKDCLLIDIDDDKRRWIITGGASNPKRRITPRYVIVPNNNVIEKNHGNRHSSIDVKDTYSMRATTRRHASNHKVQHCYEANTQNATIPTTAYFPWTAPPDPAHDDEDYHDHDIQKQQKNKRTEAYYDDIYQEHDHHRQQQQQQDDWRLKYCNLSTTSSSDTCHHDGDDSSLYLSTNTSSVQSRRERGELSSSFSSSYYYHNQHNHNNNSSDSGFLNDIVVPRNKKNRRVVWSSQQERRSDYSSSHQYHDDDEHTKEQQQQRGRNDGDALALMGNTFCAADADGMMGDDNVYSWRPPQMGRSLEDHQMRFHNSSYFKNNSDSRSKKEQQCGISVCFERPESSMYDGLFCLSSSSEQEMEELLQYSDYASSLTAKRRRRGADYYHRHF